MSCACAQFHVHKLIADQTRTCIWCSDSVFRQLFVQMDKITFVGKLLFPKPRTRTYWQTHDVLKRLWTALSKWVEKSGKKNEMETKINKRRKFAFVCGLAATPSSVGCEENMFNSGDLCKNKIKISFKTTFSLARINAALSKNSVRNSAPHSKGKKETTSIFQRHSKVHMAPFACTECSYFNPTRHEHSKTICPVCLFTFPKSSHFHLYLQIIIFMTWISVFFACPTFSIFRVALNCVHNFATMSCRCGPLYSYNK